MAAVGEQLELETTDRPAETAETQAVKEEFQAIVKAIDDRVGREMKEEMEREPHRKKSGTQDQGYRFD